MSEHRKWIIGWLLTGALAAVAASVAAFVGWAQMMTPSPLLMPLAIVSLLVALACVFMAVAVGRYPRWPGNWVFWVKLRRREEAISQHNQLLDQLKVTVKAVASLERRTRDLTDEEFVEFWESSWCPWVGGLYPMLRAHWSEEADEYLERTTINWPTLKPSHVENARVDIGTVLELVYRIADREDPRLRERFSGVRQEAQR